MAHDAQEAEMGEDSTPIDLGSDQALMWLTLQGACRWECILSMTKTFRLQDKEGTWVSP